MSKIATTIFNDVPLEVIYTYIKYDDGDLNSPAHIKVSEVYAIDSNINLFSLFSATLMARLEGQIYRIESPI